MFDAVFSGGRVRNYRDSVSGDMALSKRFNAMVRERGVLKSDNKIYVSLAHDEADIAQVTTRLSGSRACSLTPTSATIRGGRSRADAAEPISLPSSRGHRAWLLRAAAGHGERSGQAARDAWPEIPDGVARSPSPGSTRKGRK